MASGCNKLYTGGTLMKLKNKKTGEIIEPFGITCINDRTFVQFSDGKGIFKFEAQSLAELNADWEDYEEPKKYYFIDPCGEVHSIREDDEDPEDTEASKSIGNYFETKEEAEKAVEKLKAWKRLKDKGFKTFSSTICGDNFVINFKLTNHIDYSQSIDDFDCIFGLGDKE